MAMVETTFTVHAQTWVNEGSTAVNLDYLRTWREFYRQIATANIGWTLDVTTDTLNGKNGGTFAGKMTHTVTGLWYNCYASQYNSSYAEHGADIYTSDNKRLGYIWLVSPLRYTEQPGALTVYYVDSINGGVFQDCRMAQGQSSCLWRIAKGELIDGTSEAYSGDNNYNGGSSAQASSSTSILMGLKGYNDLQANVQSISYTGIYGTVGGGSQQYIGRCYGVRSYRQNGIIVTWGGKKIWRTDNTLVPKATYSINNVRYTALASSILLEE